MNHTLFCAVIISVKFKEPLIITTPRREKIIGIS